MKIDKIIFSCDDNPNYLKFWKLNSELCIKVLGITPVLFHVTDEETGFINDDYGLIKKIKRISEKSTVLQSQAYRFFGASQFSDEICILSDIDMFLFNASYVKHISEQMQDCDLLITSADAYDNDRPECRMFNPSGTPRYPVCYVVASGMIFKKILKISDSFSDYCNQLLSTPHKNQYDVDELFFSKKVELNEAAIRIKKLNRGYMSSFYLTDRIEKSNFTEKNFWKIDVGGKINYDKFIDCHCPSYLEHEPLIQKVQKELLNTYERNILNRLPYN